MNTTNPNYPTSTAGTNGSGQVARQAADDVAARVEQAGARTSQIANNTFDTLSGAVESARNATVPALERLGNNAESLARRSAEAARLKSQQLREQALRASEQTAGYIRDQPLKSVLYAAAAGALIGLLLSFTRRDR